MKVGCYVSNHLCLLAVLLLFSFSSKGVNGSRVFDFFFGGSEEANDLDTIGQGLEDFVESYYNEHVGIRAVSKEEVRTQGRRALECVAYIARIDLNKVLPDFTFVRNIAYKGLYEAFNGQEAIDGTCAYRNFLMEAESEDDDDRRSVEEMELFIEGGQQDATTERYDNNNIRQRKLATLTQPVYPSESQRYSTWVRQNIKPYINTDDLTERANATRVVRRNQNEQARLRAARIAFVSAKNSMDIVCRAVGSVEFGFDPGDFCDIIPQTFDAIRGFLQGAIDRLGREQENIDTHNRLINSAEIEAMNANAAALVDEA